MAVTQRDGKRQLGQRRAWRLVRAPAVTVPDGVQRAPQSPSDAADACRPRRTIGTDSAVTSALTWALPTTTVAVTSLPSTLHTATPDGPLRCNGPTCGRRDRCVTFGAVGSPTVALINAVGAEEFAPIAEPFGVEFEAAGRCPVAFEGPPSPLLL